ncbi:sulfur carrier protein ThiS [Caldicellulosiruptoraceae bacterium PP1]
MNIVVNGEKVTLEKEVNIKELLNILNVKMQEYVTVQLNERIIPRKDFENVKIKENDVIEFLYYMGGGSL